LLIFSSLALPFEDDGGGYGVPAGVLTWLY